jgi:hypothetical protein
MTGSGLLVAPLFRAPRRRHQGFKTLKTDVVAVIPNSMTTAVKQANAELGCGDCGAPGQESSCRSPA